MSVEIKLGGLRIRIPTIVDYSRSHLVKLLLAEHQRIITLGYAPEGAYQHVVLLELEDEFMTIVEGKSN